MKHLSYLTVALVALIALSLPSQAAPNVGDVDGTFSPGLPVNGPVYAIALQTNGQVVVGGNMAGAVVRLNSDGSADSNFLAGVNIVAGGTGAGEEIDSIALQPDGKVLIGGDFGIVRLNPDGHRDTTFVTTVNQNVNSIALQADGNVLIGGDFTVVNGTNQNNIARVNTNGILDTSFVTTADDRVFTIVVQPNGKALVGGLFFQSTARPVPTSPG
jgi:uncharacterized delta-60 repeat protein